MTIDSALNLGMPATPLTQNQEIAGELQIIYNAIRILQQVLDDAGITGGGTVPSSVIDVAHGGTGAATLTGILKGAGTAAVVGISSSTAGHLLKCTGANTYAFQAPAGAGTGDVVGPASVTADGNIAVYNATTGKLIKDGGTVAALFASPGPLGSTAANTVRGTTVKATTAAGFISSDGSTGFTGTITTASLVGKTVTIKDGIITNIA